MSDFLFDNPNIVVSPEGDVLPDPGNVEPMNPYKAKGELENMHQHFVPDSQVALGGINAVTSTSGEPTEYEKTMAIVADSKARNEAKNRGFTLTLEELAANSRLLAGRALNKLGK